jgi:hypothetical protein
MRSKLLGLALELAALVALDGAFTRASAPSLSTTVIGDANLAARGTAESNAGIGCLQGGTETIVHCGYLDVQLLSIRQREQARTLRAQTTEHVRGGDRTPALMLLAELKMVEPEPLQPMLRFFGGARSDSVRALKT